MKIKRRDFLKVSMAATAAAAVGTPMIAPITPNSEPKTSTLTITVKPETRAALPMIVGSIRALHGYYRFIPTLNLATTLPIFRNTFTFTGMTDNGIYWV